MRKKKIIAMLLAGGQGARLGVLTKHRAKPAVPFGGRFKIIDFPMSNCINSGIDTVGVLTQYRPLTLNAHIGIGIPWDLDRKNGGVTVLAPHAKSGEQGEWYSGTANAIYQNIRFIEAHNPEYVLVLAGDHIYKMDYSKMLDFHVANKCDCTIAVLEVPLSEASRFGIMNTNPDDSIYEFEEKPANPKSNLASMGIYIFSWPLLRAALIDDTKIHANSDFGKHIIPMYLNADRRMFAYRFPHYWKDVGTIESYWETNMELIKTVPSFNLYEDFWQIYTRQDHQPPQYTSEGSDVTTALLSEGCEIYGTVKESVLGPGVIVEEGAVITGSIIMEDCYIQKNAVIDRCIIDEGCNIGEGARLGTGENIANEEKPNIYNSGITVVGENSLIPPNVTVGRNCVISGVTTAEMYEGLALPSGKTLSIDDGGII